MSDPDKQPIPIDKIRNLVYDVIVHNFNIEKGTITDTSDIKGDIKADNQKEAEFKKEIEKVFGISIKEEDKTSLGTAGKIISYIENIFNK